MKSIIRTLIPALVLIIVLALPLITFATTESSGGRTFGTIQIEYRFAEGEAPDIPETIEQFGFIYHLVSQTDPVLESTLPINRTYTYEISGAITQEQIDEAGLAGITLTPVYVVFERKRDVEVSHKDTARFRNMPTNDVEDIPLSYPCVVTSGTNPSGYETKMFERTGVTFEITGYEAVPADSRTPPAGYNATVVYRGIETYSELGYYMADVVFSTTEKEGEINYYVVVASYQTEAFAPPVEEFIAEPLEPSAFGADDDLLATVADQKGNLFLDLITGKVPLGGLNITGVWSFLSMVFAIAGIFIAAVILFGAISRRRHLVLLEKLGVHYDEWFTTIKRRGAMMVVLTMIISVIALVSWLFIEDFSLGLVWVNSSTVTIGILFAITMGLGFLATKYEKRINQEIFEEADDLQITETGSV